MSPAARVWTSLGPTATPATTNSRICAKSAPAPRAMTCAKRSSLLIQLFQLWRHRRPYPCSSRSPRPRPPRKLATTQSKLAFPMAIPPASIATTISVTSAPARNVPKPSAQCPLARSSSLAQGGGVIFRHFPTVLSQKTLRRPLLQSGGCFFPRFCEILWADLHDPFCQTRWPMACDLQELKHVPLFALLDDEEAAVLASQVEVRRFAARQRIYKIGDPSGLAYVMISGRVRVSTVDEDHQEVIVDEPAHGEVFGFASMLEK